MTRVGVLASGNRVAFDTVSTTARCCELLCEAAVCTNGACSAGIVLQQSSLPWPCEWHGIDLQHCLACSGAVIAPQSIA